MYNEYLAKVGIAHYIDVSVADKIVFTRPRSGNSLSVTLQAEVWFKQKSQIYKGEAAMEISKAYLKYQKNKGAPDDEQGSESKDSREG